MDPDELVREWLKNVRTERRSTSVNGADGEADRNPFFPPDSPFARMESAPEREEAQPSRKQQHSPAPSDRKKVTESKLEGITKKENHGYERKPRHKTKEDRYEYKASKEKDKDNKKTRRSRPKRKHTINESFHAANVTQDRLTLNSRMNVGLFRKGRTSSPVKSRELPDLAFSEMNFLSKRSRQGPEDLPEDRHQMDELQMGIPQYFSNDYPEEPPHMDECVSFPRHDMQAQTDPLAISFSTGNGEFTVEHTTYDDTLPARVQRNFKHRRGRKKSSSSTSCTWPESECEAKEPRVSSEDCQKGLLCADINHQHISDTEKAKKRYWDLDELKLILSIRQRRRYEDELRKASVNPLKRKRPSFEAEEVLIRHSKRTQRKAKRVASSRRSFCSSPSSSAGSPHGKSGPLEVALKENEIETEKSGPEDNPKTLEYSDGSQETQGGSPLSDWDITEELPIHDLNLETEWADVLVGSFPKETTHDNDNDVVMNDFDAAYSAIMRSADEDPTIEILHGIASNEGDFSTTKDRQSLVVSSHTSLDASKTKNTSFHQQISSEPPPQGASVDGNGSGLWHGHLQSMALAFGMESTALGTEFSWRQNRLY